MWVKKITHVHCHLLCLIDHFKAHRNNLLLIPYIFCQKNTWVIDEYMQTSKYGMKKYIWCAYRLQDYSIYNIITSLNLKFLPWTTSRKVNLKRVRHLKQHDQNVQFINSMMIYMLQIISVHTIEYHLSLSFLLWQIIS